MTRAAGTKFAIVSQSIAESMQRRIASRTMPWAEPFILIVSQTDDTSPHNVLNSHGFHFHSARIRVMTGDAFTRGSPRLCVCVVGRTIPLFTTRRFSREHEGVMQEW